MQQLGKLMLLIPPQRDVGDRVKAQALRMKVRGGLVKQRSVLLEARLELDFPVRDRAVLALDPIVRRVLPAGKLHRRRLRDDVPDRRTQRCKADEVGLGRGFCLYRRRERAQVQQVDGARACPLDEPATGPAPGVAVCWLSWRFSR